MSFLSVLLPPDLSAIKDSSIVRTIYSWVDEGPTFNRGTLIGKPLSGSFLPFNAGSCDGSVPDGGNFNKLCDSLQYKFKNEKKVF